MKYLKTFEATFSGYELLPYSITQEIREICLELSDEGFRIETQNIFDYRSPPMGFLDTHYTSLSIGKFKEFKAKEIKEVVDRIKDYLSDHGYEILIPDMIHRKYFWDEFYFNILIYFRKK